MNRFALKIKALLHDPPHKPISLMNDRVSHEAVGEELIQILLGEEDSRIPTEVKKADHIASAADRYNFPFDWTEPWRFRENFLKTPVLIHPLSGVATTLENMKGLDVQRVKDTSKKAIQQIANDYISTESRYLALWRLLPELVKQHDEEGHELGELWDLLPADTRIPDHSIWSHQRTVSALAGSGIGKGHKVASLAVFSIGPVQEFIAASKKTQDLWSGSSMLSWLSWTAMKVVANTCGPDSILFPDLHGQPFVDLWLTCEKGITIPDFKKSKAQIPTLPNRFFAILPTNEAADHCKEAEIAVKAELMKIGEFVWNKLNLADTADKDLWKQQHTSFIETYWTVLPIPDLETVGIPEDSFHQKFATYFKGVLDWDGDSEFSKNRTAILDAFDKGGFKTNIGTVYGRLYEIVDKLNGSRKSLRNFDQVSETGYRCTLIPKLAALLPKGEPDTIPTPKAFREFWVKLQEKYPRKMGTNERLSPVALSKRFFGDYLDKEQGVHLPQFVSTHSFAAADFKYAVLTQYLSDNNDEFSNAIVHFYDKVRALENALKKGDSEDIQLFEKFVLPKLSALFFKQKGADKILPIKDFTGINGLMFFPDLLTPEYVADYFEVLLTDDLKKAVQDAGNSAKRLISLAKKFDIPSPNKYYGIIQFDGDNMGKWLSGHESPEFRSMIHPEIATEIHLGGEGVQFDAWESLNSDNLKRPLSPSLHASISTSLNHFSLHLAKRIVEQEFLGKLVYAGGDDVVAMVSFNDALPCAEMLRLAYSGLVEESQNDDQSWKLIPRLTNPSEDKQKHISGYVYLRTGWKGADSNIPLKRVLSTMGSNASASAGVSIVHMYHPLKQALMEARAAEKTAKNTYNRDAFAVRIVKRSGETYTTGTKWFCSAAKNSLVISDVFNKLIEDVRSGLLSPKCAVDMESEIGALSQLTPDAVKAEFFRIYLQHTEAMRKQLSRDKTVEPKVAVLKRYEETIGALLTIIISNHDSNQTGKSEITNRYEKAMSLIKTAFYLGKGGLR
jgi:CRISPR-associated protein Cmr2